MFWCYLDNETTETQTLQRIQFFSLDNQTTNTHSFKDWGVFFPLDNETTKHMMECEYGCPVVQAMGKAWYFMIKGEFGCPVVQARGVA